MKLSKFAVLSTILITASAFSKDYLEASCLRNQGHPQPASKRGKFKRRNRNRKGK